MEIFCINACKRKLPSGATQTYPAGWSGDVPSEIASEWVAKGNAERVTGVAPAVQFSAAQTLALAVVADQVLANAAAAADGGDTDGEGDAGDGEAEDAGDADGGDGEPEPLTREQKIEVLAALTPADLKALAKEKKVTYVGVTRDDLIAALADI